jgi:hypothetical protein
MVSCLTAFLYPLFLSTFCLFSIPLTSSPILSVSMAAPSSSHETSAAVAHITTHTSSLLRHLSDLFLSRTLPYLPHALSTCTVSLINHPNFLHVKTRTTPPPLLSLSLFSLPIPVLSFPSLRCSFCHLSTIPSHTNPMNDDSNASGATSGRLTSRDHDYLLFTSLPNIPPLPPCHIVPLLALMTSGRTTHRKE